MVTGFAGGMSSALLEKPVLGEQRREGHDVRLMRHVPRTADHLERGCAFGQRGEQPPAHAQRHDRIRSIVHDQHLGARSAEGAEALSEGRVASG